MMTIILRKVWGDLTHNKARTLLAVLSIAVGILALSTLASLRPARAATHVSVREALAYE